VRDDTPPNAIHQGGNNMIRQHGWQKGTALALAITGAAVIGVSGQELSTQTPHARRGLQGTWRVEVTIIDCATGVERPPFWAMLTFAEGGTLTETTTNQALPGVRTPGHGAWSRSRAGSYTAVSEAFLLFGPGFRPWTHRISQDIEMDSSDQFTSRATVEFTLTPGTLPPPPVPLPAAAGCAHAVGYRFD
jgi:hypothetical protein